MQPGLKAGLINGMIQILFFDLPWILMLFIPFKYVGQIILFFYCFSLPFFLTPGILGAYWLKKPRTVNQGVITGALAGLASGVLGSFNNLLVFYLLFDTDLHKTYLNKILPAEISKIIQQQELVLLAFPKDRMIQLVISLIFTLAFLGAINSFTGLLYVVIRRE